MERAWQRKNLLRCPKLLDLRMLSPNDSAKDNKKIADEIFGRVIYISPEFHWINHETFLLIFLEMNECRKFL